MPCPSSVFVLLLLLTISHPGSFSPGSSSFSLFASALEVVATDQFSIIRFAPSSSNVEAMHPLFLFYICSHFSVVLTSSKEADSMSAMRSRMNKADKAMWMDMKFYTNNGIAEGRKHKRYRKVVQSCILHSCESWSWNKEMVDALHGWASGNLDLVSSRRWAQMPGVVQGQSDQESWTKIH